MLKYHQDMQRHKVQSARRGFTVIEVMIFLAITGLLLLGALGGTYASIATQRYNDSVRSFAEFLRQIYAEVISPETQGGGNSNSEAIYGKIAVFGLNSRGIADDTDIDNTVYTVTLVGDTDINSSASGFVEELGSVHAHLYCGTSGLTGDTSSTLASYTPLWGAKLRDTNNNPFTGTVIIARSPSSGLVHTAYTEEIFDVQEGCEPTNVSASNSFKNYLASNPDHFSMTDELDFCILSNNSFTVRDIRLAADGRNTSAISIIEDNANIAGGTRCSR